MKTNHPAHGPVSLNRLLQISEILSKAAAQSDGGNLGYAMADAVKVIDGAIASFGAEPVAWLHSDNGIGIPAITRSRNVADSWFSKGWNIKPLYTTPPASVVPDAISTRQAIAKMENHEPCDSINVAYKYGWNACRAAMLQAGNHTEQHLDMVDHSGDTNENGSDDTFIDEGTKPAGNSPVTPDGCIPVSDHSMLPPLEYLDTVKFNADCAIQDPESIYTNEFFLSLDEVFGERGNYSEPVQAKAVSMLIAEVFRLRGYSRAAPHQEAK